MTDCPYCGEPLEGDLALPHMSERQQTIYNAITKGANWGVKTSSLVKLIGSNGPGGGIVLRVQIHEINKKLVSVKQRIKGGGGVYRLEKR